MTLWLNFSYNYSVNLLQILHLYIHPDRRWAYVLSNLICIKLKKKMLWLDFFSPKKHKRNVLSWSRVPMSSKAFFNHFEGRYGISEFRTSTWYLFSHSPLLQRKSYSFVRLLPHLLMVKYHLLSMKYFVDVTLFIPK